MFVQNKFKFIRNVLLHITNRITVAYKTEEIITGPRSSGKMRAKSMLLQVYKCVKCVHNNMGYRYVRRFSQTNLVLELHTRCAGSINTLEDECDKFSKSYTTTGLRKSS